MMGVGKYAVMEEAVEREVDVMVKGREAKGGFEFINFY